jgi:hypothetical protein
MMPMLSRAVLVLALCSLIFLLGFPLYMDCAAFLLAAVAGAFVARSKLLLLFGLFCCPSSPPGSARGFSQSAQPAPHVQTRGEYSAIRYEAGVDATSSDASGITRD